MTNASKYRDECFKSLIALLGGLLLFLATPKEVKATHGVGGYVRLICVDAATNTYKIQLIWYRDEGSTIETPSNYTVHVDPVDPSEGPDMTFTAAMIQNADENDMPTVKTGPCHAPPEDPSLIFQEGIYETPTFTLNPASSGYNIYNEHNGTVGLCCRNHEILNIANPNTASQILFMRSYDRQEFPCNSSPEFLNYPPSEICINDSLAFDYSASDPNGGFDTSTLVITQDPMHGSVTVNSNTGEVDYQPDPGYVGADSFTYQVCDISSFGSECEEATIYVDAGYQNIKPQATNDQLTTTINNKVSKDLIANDIDFDGSVNPYSLMVLEDVNNGSLFYYSSGTMEYTPNPGFTGIDSFMYSVCDAGDPQLCDTAMGYITVAEAMDAPLAVDDYVVLNGNSTNINVTSNDQSFFSGINTASVEVIQPPSNGSANKIVNVIQYQAGDKSSGLDSFRYVVCNMNSPASCDSATVYITREAQDYPPFAVRDTATILMNTTGVIDVIENDLDKTEVLNYLGVTVTSSPMNGTTVVTGNGIEYTPANGFYGLDSFQYQVCDGGDENYCDETTVYILVVNPNFKPVAVDDKYLIDPDEHPLDSLLVLSNDFDPDNILGVDCDSTEYTDTIFRDSIIFDKSKIGDLNPDANEMAANNIDSFYYDLGGITAYDIDTIITYDTTNLYDTSYVYDTISTSPLVVDTTESYDTTYIYDTTTHYDHNNIDFIEYNDLITDPYYTSLFQVNSTFEDTLKLIEEFVNPVCFGSFQVIAGPEHGTIPDGYPLYYDPDPGFSGIDTLYYEICDGTTPEKCDTAMVLLFVKANNFLPFVAADTILPPCFEPVDINVLENDNVWNEDFDLNTLAITSPPKHGTVTQTGDSTFTYQIDSAYVGVDSFTYSICDESGDCSSNVVYVNADVLNLAPDARNDKSSINANGVAIIDLLANDEDPEGDLASESFKLITPPANGDIYLTRQGEMLYEPNSGFSGIDSFMYEICDWGIPTRCDQAMVYIEVGGSAPPEAIDDNYTVSGFSPTAIDVLANDNIAEGALDERTLSIKSPPAYGNVEIGHNSQLIYQPSEFNPTGTVQFTYSICNSAIPIACDEATVSLTIDVNEVPQVNDDNIDVEFGKPYFFDPLANDEDPDGQLRFETAEVITPPSNGEIFVLADSGMVYVPDPNYSGSDQFEYQICDDGMPIICETATVDITIPPNDPPEANDVTQNARFNAPTLINVVANDSDPYNDLDKSSVRVVDAPDHGTTAVDLNGNIYYQPDNDYYGTDEFEYQVSDHANPLQTDVATVSLTVGYDPATLPLAKPDFHNISENSYGIYSLAANDDPSVDLSTLKIINPPANGDAYILPNGEVYYKPDTNFFGTDVMEYLVCQSPLQYNCDIEQVEFSVAEVNHPITANDDQAEVYEDHYRDIYVLENDVDKDRQTTTYTINITSPPSKGTATVIDNKFIRYSATAGATGSDNFTYEVCDGLGCDPADVTVSLVSSENISPSVLHDRYWINIGEPISLNPLDNDIDPDRDSLAYRFCEALEGEPYNRPNMPPFEPVTYTGGFTFNDPIPSNPPLNIDPETGLLTGVPNGLGAYVITVCVEEYKNGKFLGDTRSEIQVKVVNCTNEPDATIDSDVATNGTILSCDSKTVNFTNLTPDINDYEFQWDFGVQGIISDTSNEVHPTYTYPDTGTYEATLTVAPGAACEDQATVTVLVYDSPEADFAYTKPLCRNQPIQFTDESDPVNKPIADWSWHFSASEVKTGKSVAKAYSNTGPKSVELIVTSTTGCSDAITKQFDIYPSPEVDLPNDIKQICVNDTLTLEADYTTNSTIKWSPQQYLIPTSNPGVVKISRGDAGGGQYKATVTNQHGCSVDDKVTFIALNRPTVDAGDLQRMCHQESAMLDGDVGSVTYLPDFEWKPAGSLNNPNSFSPLASPDTTTTYTFTVSKDNGKYCVESDTVTVFAELPNLDIQAEKLALCSNEYTKLSAITNSNRVTFDWSPAGSLSDANEQYPTASPDTNTTYTLTMYDSATQCAVTEEITVEVIDVTQSPLRADNDTTICRGDTVDLLGSNGNRYLWKQDTTLSCLCCESPEAWPTEATTYTLTGIDSNGCKAEDTVRVSIYDNPNVEAKGDTTICPGQPVEIELIGAESYIWYDDTTKNCTNCNSLTITPEDSNAYVMEGIDSNGCGTLDTVVVDIYPPPSTDFTSPPEICKGDTTQLNLQGAETYNWSPAGSLNDPSAEAPLAYPEQTTDYTVSGTDTNNCAYSDTITVTVNTLAEGKIIGDTSLCIGDEVELFAEGFSTYHWTPSASLSCDSCPTPIASPQMATDYEVFVADSNGCKDTGQVYVDVYELPEIDLTVPEDSFCIGENVQLEAAGGDDYSWSPATGLDDSSLSNPVATPTNDVEYTLTVTDQNGCQNDTTQPIVVHQLPTTDAGPDTAICFEDTIQLSATGADSFTWSGSNGQYITCTDCPDPVVAPINTTEYTVTGYNQFGCSYKDTIEVKVNPDPDDIDISADTIICAGDSTELFVSGGSQYEWNPSPSLSCTSCDMPVAKPTDTELFSVQVFTEKGCYRYFDVEVAVRELPEANVTADTGLCIENSITLEVSGASNFEWTPPQGLSAPDIANPEASPVTPTHYTVKVSDDLGCFDTDSVFVDVYIPADPNAQPDTVICINKPLKVRAENGVQYQWMPAEVFDDPTSASPTTTLTASQEMVVEITDSNGCYNADTIYAEVKGNPDFSLTEDVKIYEGTSTVLQIQGNDSYTWDPLVGIIDSGQNYIQVQPEDTVEYVVTGTTAFGCVARDSVVVTPIPRLEMYLPNAFTPNNDGKNDYFRIKSNDEFEALSLQIYDRWGNLLHTTDDPYHGWDGTVGGEPMPIGTYVYVLEVEDQLGNRDEYQGNVTLIR